MTRARTLSESLKMAEHNLYRLSANGLMDNPAPGYERVLQRATDEVKMLNDWLTEINAGDNSNGRKIL